MSVATYSAPNSTTQDSSSYKGNIDGGMSVLHQTAGMFAPHSSSPAAMTITIDAGSLMNPTGIIETQAAQVSGTITAPVLHSRIDLGVIDVTTGVLPRRP